MEDPERKWYGATARRESEAALSTCSHCTYSSLDAWSRGSTDGLVGGFFLPPTNAQGFLPPENGGLGLAG